MFNINDFYNHPKVHKMEWEDLVIFTYSRECQYDRSWDDITMAARGIIFNKVTGELIARPFKKFFNLTETFETSFGNLPDGPFVATEKVDGSLGICFPYKDQYWIATKGSFQSVQAIWATEWLRNNVHTKVLKGGWTYLFEVVYKENKIVVDYGDFEGLVLLSAVNIHTGEECTYQQMVEEAGFLGVRPVKQEPGFSTLEELYEYCKALPATQEGFVVTFSNGLKVKIKGDTYCRIHKMISRMTPLSYWEAWDLDLKDIPKEYLAQLPEEFRDVSDALYQQIYDMHWEPFKRIVQLYEGMKALLGPGANKKTWAMRTKELHPQEFSSIMGLHNGKEGQVWWGLHKNVRPTWNILPQGVAGTDRIKRILSDS